MNGASWRSKNVRMCEHVTLRGLLNYWAFHTGKMVQIFKALKLGRKYFELAD